ncbi:MAG: hypothetical protein LBM92_07955, partial [Opitutaceae bacterium]|nr:hypothetical protein [Opitutaceae bacterium]
MPVPDISRRRFLATAVTGGILAPSALGALSGAPGGNAAPPPVSPKTGYTRPQTVGALYFRAQLYTIVPGQV